MIRRTGFFPFWITSYDFLSFQASTRSEKLFSYQIYSEKSSRDRYKVQKALKLKILISMTFPFSKKSLLNLITKVFIKFHTEL